MDSKILEKAFAALSKEVRITILKMLVEKGKKGLCPCDILNTINMSNANLSFHLKELENAGFLEKEKKGKFIYYYAKCDFVKNISDFLLNDCSKYNNKED